MYNEHFFFQKKQLINYSKMCQNKYVIYIIIAFIFGNIISIKVMSVKAYRTNIPMFCGTHDLFAQKSCKNITTGSVFTCLPTAVPRRTLVMSLKQLQEN